MWNYTNLRITRLSLYAQKITQRVFGYLKHHRSIFSFIQLSHLIPANCIFKIEKINIYFKLTDVELHIVWIFWNSWQIISKVPDMGFSTFTFELYLKIVTMTGKLSAWQQHYMLMLFSLSVQYDKSLTNDHATSFTSTFPHHILANFMLKSLKVIMTMSF